MKISPMQFKLIDIAENYSENDADNSVTGLNGRLDIRPKYQRQFVYPKDKQDAVVRSVLSDYPINVMYWVQTGKNQADEPTYEVLDGQQRLISLCRFMKSPNAIQFNGKAVTYGGLIDKSVINNYRHLTVYVCEQEEHESNQEFHDKKLEWFKTINVVGTKLTQQEIRSALCYGPWVTSAKFYFVHKDNTGSTAYSYGLQDNHPANKYILAKNMEKTEQDKQEQKGNSDDYNRQFILETVLSWITGDDTHLGDSYAIEKYMKEHQNNPDASELWNYFTSVMNWVWSLFPIYYSDMKKVDWGILYNKYHNDKKLSATALQPRIDALLIDTEVQKRENVWQYVLDTAYETKDTHDISKEKILNLRSFNSKEFKNLRAAQYLKQHGVCPVCMKRGFNEDEMQGDHIVPWSKGGKTVEENMQMICAGCNGYKLAQSYDVDTAKKRIKKVESMTAEEVAKLSERVLG